jgi:hypothetical protein
VFAVNFTHPIETVKTRMQVSGQGIGPTVSALYTNEGVAAFWKGIAFAYGREISYTSIKLGAYAPVRDWLGAGKDAPFYMKFLAGAITGGVGSFVGNPFDVMKTLAQTNKDKALPLSQMVGNMFRDQGIAGFYRGVEANIMRGEYFHMQSRLNTQRTEVQTFFLTSPPPPPPQSLRIECHQDGCV